MHRPGWLNDRSSAEFERLFSTTPERAASDILNAIVKNHGRQLIGHDARLLDFLQRLMPSVMQGLVVAGARRRRRKLMAADAGSKGALT